MEHVKSKLSAYTKSTEWSFSSIGTGCFGVSSSESLSENAAFGAQFLSFSPNIRGFSG